MAGVNYDPDCTALISWALSCSSLRGVGVIFNLPFVWGSWRFLGAAMYASVGVMLPTQHRENRRKRSWSIVIVPASHELS